MASWLVRSPPVWVQALAGDIVLCSWARHSHGASLQFGVQRGTGELNAVGNPTEMD